jgi:hypothetical protein
MTENRSGRPYPPERDRGPSKLSISRLRRAPPIVFPADACGCRARGLERELKCPEATKKKANA